MLRSKVNSCVRVVDYYVSGLSTVNVALVKHLIV